MSRGTVGIRYGSVRLLLYGPVMLLPLPILTFIVRLASYLNSTADRGRKGLFLPLALSVEKKNTLYQHLLENISISESIPVVRGMPYILVGYSLGS